LRRIASRAAHALAWLFLIAGLILIAMNPGVLSLRYAILWLGVMATARGASTLVPWVAAAVDLSLFFVCCLGLDIGGLILIPSILLFLVADVLGVHVTNPRKAAESEPIG
jgi:hypothetical protein